MTGAIEVELFFGSALTTFQTRRENDVSAPVGSLVEDDEGVGEKKPVAPASTPKKKRQEGARAGFFVWLGCHCLLASVDGRR